MAARKVDEAKVILSADATKLQKTIQQSIGKINSLGASALKVSTKIAGIGVAAGVAAGVGVAALVSKSITAIDKIGKLSDRLGIATRTLGRFQHIASLSGIELNTFTTAIQRAQRRTAEAAKGNKELSKTFSELGLSPNALLRMGAEERFYAIADALNGVSNSSERLRLAFKLFDTEGVAVLQATKEGTAALREMSLEADRLGLSLSEQAVDGVERADDAITRLKNLFTGIAYQMTSALAPALEKIVTLIKDNLLEAIEANGGSVETWARNVVLNVIKMVGEVTLAIEAFLLNALTVMGKVRARFGFEVDGIKDAQTQVHKIFETIINQLVLMGVEVRNGLPVTGFGESGGNTGTPSSGDGSEAVNSFKEGALKAGASIRESFENLALDVREPIKSIGQSIENTFIGAANKIFSEIVGNLLSKLSENLFTNLGLGKLLGFAGGGTVTANKPILVGERGPELFVPSSVGKIRNNHDTRGMMGGGGVQQHNSYHFDLVPSPTIKAMVEQGIAQAMPVIKADIFKALQRGY